MSGWNVPPPIEVVHTLEAYSTPSPQGPIDLELAGNEGPSPPKEVLEALATIDGEVIRRYPDLTRLTEAIADRFDVSTEQVIVTAGGDQAIDLLARAYLEPGRSLLTHRPSFIMIERAARFAGGEVIDIEWPGSTFPIETFIDAGDDSTPIAMIVSPNNPTGATIDPDELRTIAAELAPTLVVIDHAYVEFTDEDLTEVAIELDNVAVIRTLSKAFGLAGLRVGYLIGPEPVVEALGRIRSPFPIASPAIVAAEARLEADSDVSGYLEAIRANRDRLEDSLTTLDIEVYPSEANFVLGRYPDPRWAFDGLAGLGIRTRSFPNRLGLEEHIRITVPGDANDMGRLEAALEAVLAPATVLFDMDGVIAGVGSSYRRAIIETAATFGVEVTHEDIEGWKQAGDANDDWELTHRILLDAGVSVAFEAVKDTFEGLYQGAGDQPPLYEHESLHGETVIAELAERFPLGIVTGRPRRDAVRFLEDHEITDLFEVVICKEDATDKPHPAPVNLALERLDLDRAWMIGDTPDDIRAARDAGVVPIGIHPPGEVTAATETALRTAGAARVLHELEGIIDLLDRGTTLD